MASGSGHVYHRSGFVYVAYSPPIWSYVLALLLKLPGSTGTGIQVLQSILCFASSITYATLARRISGNPTVGLFTGLVVALQPSLLFYSVVKSDPLPLNVLLLGLIAQGGADLILKPHPGGAAAFGVLLAAGVLSRGTPIVALPVVAVWLVVRWRRQAAIPLMVMVTTLALGVAPWLIRNERLLGRALITTTAGENFWRGNHEGASGGVLDENGGQITTLLPSNEALPSTIRSVLRSGTELDRQDIFMNEALSFIREKPGLASSLFLRKMRTFWWKIESDASDYSPFASLAYEVIYRMELALALLGGFVLLRSPREATPAPDRTAAGFALAVMIAISVLQSGFYVQGRHRFLIEPLLLMFTACGILEAAKKLAWRRRLPGSPRPDQAAAWRLRIRIARSTRAIRASRRIAEHRPGVC